MSAVAALGLLPKIEGFAPLPIASMIPFMEAQSASLAYAFGINYEFGKRKIKSMSNEEFNSLTLEKIENMTASHTSVYMEGLQRKLPDSINLQKEIIELHKDIEVLKARMNVDLIKELPITYINAFYGGEQGIRDLRSENKAPVATDDTVVQTNPESYEGATHIHQDETGTVTTSTPINAQQRSQEKSMDQQYERAQYLARRIAAYEKLKPRTEKIKQLIAVMKTQQQQNMLLLNATQNSYKKLWKKYYTLK